MIGLIKYFLLAIFFDLTTGFMNAFKAGSMGSRLQNIYMAGGQPPLVPYYPNKSSKVIIV